ncbi:hypothetical protein POM88_033138 [Heracleum sosnowskyi]|uniref:Uncharacterized protein n=1 Tax=Heracleum sosnowskyi TaxID=360622 RepID=A0AAD8I3M1_9APIA|nr:hypothetical protein POM88_033138 [Heracleum sosnowskyi]
MWMRAEPRRKAYTMGSKWLRHGGLAQSHEAGDEGERKTGNSEIGAEAVSHPNKVGIMKIQNEREIRKDGILLLGGIKGNTAGMGSVSVSPVIVQNSNAERENNVEEIESNGLSFLDPKRRRTDDPILDRPAVFEANEDDLMLDTESQNNNNQKNELLAGAARQARHAL